MVRKVLNMVLLKFNSNTLLYCVGNAQETKKKKQ